jgi:HAE1 family hydrophobic/amphiphilic exporter-1
LGLESFSVAPLGTGLVAESSLAFRVGHRDLAICRAASRRIQERLAKVPGITDVRDNVREGPLQVQVVPQEPACSEFALTPYDIAAALRTANSGMTAGTLRDAARREELPIRVQLARDGRSSLQKVLSLQLRSPLGAAPRLEDLAEPYYDQGFTSLYRYNGLRVITISAALQGVSQRSDTAPVGIARVQEIVRAEFARLQAEEPGLTLSMGGGYSSQQDTASRMGISALVAAALIYLILLVQFRSYILPFLVLLTLVFACLGVIAGLSLHGYALSVVTAVSLVGLFGVAVNDAIILIDFINQGPADQNDRFAHVLAGARLRLRPIVLTTVTTVVGLLPMATGLCGFSSIWSPFAVCFCYGLTAATLMTLVFIPCCYAMCDDLARLINRVLPQTEG